MQKNGILFRGALKKPIYSGEQTMMEARPEDLEFAAKIVRQRLGSVNQAATTCGVPVRALEAYLSTRPHHQTKHKDDSRGSVSTLDEPDQSRAAGRQAEETTDYFVFYLDGGHWVWRRINSEDIVVKSAEHGFDSYLDCVADARPHGFTGKPLFIFAESDLVAKTDRRAGRSAASSLPCNDDGKNVIAGSV